MGIGFLSALAAAVQFANGPYGEKIYPIAKRVTCTFCPGVSASPVGFGASSLDSEINAFVVTREAEEFFAVREVLFPGIIEQVDKSGTGVAFPLQTLYLGRDHAPGEQAGTL